MNVLRGVGRSLGRAALDRIGRTASRVQESRPLRPDLLESEEAYVAVFDAPGATASDVQVRFVDGKVLVRIDRFRPHHEGYEMRYPGRPLAIDGRVRLPREARIDADDATATLRSNGTLEVHMPKRTGARGDGSVSVQTEEPGR